MTVSATGSGGWGAYAVAGDPGLAVLDAVLVECEEDGVLVGLIPVRPYLL